MAVFRNFLSGVRSIFRKESVEREMDQELHAYLQSATQEKMRRGMRHDEARRAAQIEMGGLENVKEQVREASWETSVETLWKDLCFGSRLLASTPMFTAAAVLSLALGIGANTAIFQLLDAIRLRALPVKNSCEMAVARRSDWTLCEPLFQLDEPHLGTDSCPTTRLLERFRMGAHDLQYLAWR